MATQPPSVDEDNALDAHISQLEMELSAMEGPTERDSGGCWEESGVDG